MQRGSQAHGLRMLENGLHFFSLAHSLDKALLLLYFPVLLQFEVEVWENRILSID